MNLLFPDSFQNQKSKIAGNIELIFFLTLLLIFESLEIFKNKIRNPIVDGLTNCAKYLSWFFILTRVLLPTLSHANHHDLIVFGLHAVCLCSVYMPCWLCIGISFPLTVYYYYIFCFFFATRENVHVYL